jgi:hypothetical protein
MAAHRGDERRDQPPTLLMVLEGIAAFGPLLGVWIALAGKPGTQELVAGSATATVAVAGRFYVGRQGRALPAFRWTDLGMRMALPGRSERSSALSVAQSRTRCCCELDKKVCPRPRPPLAPDPVVRASSGICRLGSPAPLARRGHPARHLGRRHARELQRSCVSVRLCRGRAR